MADIKSNLKTQPIELDRLPGHAEQFPEQKDPSCIECNPEDKDTLYRYIIYTTSGRSCGQKWSVARYGTNDLKKSWQELEPPVFEGLSGPQLCAPALSYEFKNGKAQYHLYIQTACFEEGGVILEAVSDDGIHFQGLPAPLVTPQSIKNPKRPVKEYTIQATHRLASKVRCTIALRLRVSPK